MTTDWTFSDFSDYLRLELNRSELTAEAHLRDLRQFSSWLTDSKPEQFDASSVTSGDIRGWLTALSRSGDSPRSLRRKTQSLRSYYRFLMKRGEMTQNPAADVALAKISKPLPEFARTEEIERLLARPINYESEEETMARLILLLLYSTGIRQAELLGLHDRDISRSAGEAHITGKRDKQRLVPLPLPLLEEIAKWQHLRDKIHPDLPEPKPLFVLPDGNPLTKSALYRIVSEMMKETSATHKGAHTLRHTFATSMLNNGADLDTVKEFLGHESLATTQIYTHLSYSQLLRDYRAAHPRSAKKDTPEKS